MSDTIPTNAVIGDESTISSMSTADLADHIQSHEGWTPGSRSYRNNNPGNMKVAGDLGRDEGDFGKFSSYDEGRAALEKQIGSFQQRFPHWSPTNLAARWLGSNSGDPSQVNPSEGNVQDYGKALTPSKSSPAAPVAQQSAPQSPVATPQAEALPQGATIGESLPANASVQAPAQAPAQAEALPQGAQVGEQAPDSRNFIQKAQDAVETPLIDQLTGKKDATQNFITGLSGDTPEEFAQKHPYLNIGAHIGAGLTSPEGLLLALGSGGESLLADAGLEGGATALNLARRGANVYAAGQGVVGAGKAGADIAQNGLNPKNATQGGLSIAQILLGVHGGAEVSGALDKPIPDDLLADGMRPVHPDGTPWDLGDLEESHRANGLNPDLAQSTQSPILNRAKSYLSGTYFGSGPLERNQKANQAIIDTFVDKGSAAETAKDLEAAKTAATPVKSTSSLVDQFGSPIETTSKVSDEAKQALQDALSKNEETQNAAPTSALFNNTLAATPGQHSTPELIASYLLGHGIHHGPLGYLAGPMAENILARLLTNKTFSKLMLTPSNGAATALLNSSTK